MSTTEQSEAQARTAVDVQPGGAEAMHEAPPAGEDIHLPGPSVIPLVCAIGITLTVIGTTIDWIWSVLGLIIFVASVAVWVRDVRRDVDSLPEEHHH